MGGALTEKEKEILKYIRLSVETHGFPPSIREICSAFNISSTNGVRYYLNRMESKGFIRRNRRISRGIELVSSAVEQVLDTLPELASIDAIYASGGIPILGRVAAGAPLLAEENVDDVLYLEGFVAQHRGLFALRVKGDSMQNAGILDSDIVVVRQQSDAQNGDIVVALLDDEATVKRYRRTADRVALVPENPTYTPIILGPDSFSRMQILGRVTAVLRRYD